MTQEEIDALISGVDETDLDTPEAANEEGEVADTSFTELTNSESEVRSLDPKMDLLYDLQLPVSIELGRTNMLIREVLRLGRGSVVEFDKLVSEPVDLLINGKKIAEGEVVVIDKHFGVRITTLVDSATNSRSRK
jgi:flagellar motor switch protein FliN/FliY